MKMKHALRTISCTFGFLLLAVSLHSQAAIITFSSAIDGAQANAGMGTGSTGFGSASMMYDDNTGTFSWDVSWSGLTGDITVAHFHGPALPGVNAGVQVTIDPMVNPSSGSAMISTIQLDDLLAGLWYINIHSTFAPGGEIRGQVFVDQAVGVSAPSMLVLFMASSLVCLTRRRKNI
jgi:hypothetical protein